MRAAIQSIDFVSDGILVHFNGGLRCYYPASFLLDHVHDAENQVFLDFDPSPEEDSSGGLLEEFASADAERTLSVC